MQLEPSHIAEFGKARPDKGAAVLCHAPFKSIFFNTGGKLFTCCFNRIYTLGTYPQQSVRDIWFGEKANALREAMKRNDLTMGCQICGHMLAAKNYEGIAIKNFDYPGMDAQGYPTKMDFELSNICNLECVMCRGEHSSSIRQNREKRPPLPNPYDAAFIRQLEEFIPHLQYSHFLGGEPFLIPQCLELWEKMIELNPAINISVQTNATVFNERIKRILDAMPFSISVSIDSIEKNLYEQIRVNARFERVMENIGYFKDYCHRKGKKLNISYCPMNLNWRELPRVVEFCNELNADLFFNTVTLPVKYSLGYLSSSELGNVIAYLQQHDLPEENDVQRFNKKSLNGVINQLAFWQQQAVRKERITNGKPHNGSVNEFLKMLKDYIDLYSPEVNGEKQKTYLDIEAKIEYILHSAGEEGLLDEAREYITAIDPLIICDFFPNNKKEDLYDLLKIHAGIQ